MDNYNSGSGTTVPIFVTLHSGMREISTCVRKVQELTISNQRLILRRVRVGTSKENVINL